MLIIRKAIVHYKKSYKLDREVGFFSNDEIGLHALFGSTFGLDFFDESISDPEKQWANFNVCVLRSLSRSTLLAYKCIYFIGETDEIADGWPKIVIGTSIEHAYEELIYSLKNTRNILWEEDKHWQYWGHANRDDALEIAIVYIENIYGDSKLDRLIIVGPAVMAERE